jgi:predicted O-linked N-acetylglucosamine transferase (SPINDLY family)
LNLQRARALYESGALPQAQALYAEVLKSEPRHYECLHMLGVIAARAGDPAGAVELISRAIGVEPKRAAAYCNRGLAFERQERPEAALADYDAAIGLDPSFWGGYFNRAKLQRRLRRFEAALVDYDAAIAIQSARAEAFAGRADVLFVLERWEEALASYQRAIELEPRDADAHCNRGAALVKLGRMDAALAGFDAAIAIDAAHLEAHYNRGKLLQDLQRREAALAGYDCAIEIDPGYAPAHLNRGIVLEDLGRWQEALAAFDRAIALDAGLAEAHLNRADVLEMFKRPQAALESYDRAMSIKPQMEFLRGQRRHTKMQLCDWDGFEADLAVLCAGIERGEAVCAPFAFLALSGSAALHRRAAEIWARERGLLRQAPRAPFTWDRHERIRVGYFSADFRSHPVSRLTAELFETHDRQRFDVTAFAWGPDTPDAMRTRLRAAFDRFIDVDRLSDEEIAQLAQQMELDIAVDLGGYTRGSRPGIFAACAAPIQVGFLGYPGTLGAPFMDYLVADRTLVPPDQRGHYSEKILHLPSYQPNDATRRIAGGSLDRESHGLPAAAFVYCCFNGSYKITPGAFDAWMRILKSVPGSVLWLRSAGDHTNDNLRREARARGIAPERLIFAPRLEAMEDHLARHRLADLFLDTWPFGAHTTAADALWAGLPVLTCAGEGFASRVGASLLSSIGLSALIAASVGDYVRLAQALAADRPRLAELARRLAERRRDSPLFDTRSFAKHLESGYFAIHQRHRAGLPPEDLEVGPPPDADAGRNPAGGQDFHFER